MTDHRMLMTAENRLAIREGRKTQTRRIVSFGNSHTDDIVPRKHWDCLLWRGSDVAPTVDGCPVNQYWHVDYDDPECVSVRVRVYPRIQPGDMLLILEPHWRYGLWLPDGQTRTGKVAWRFAASSPGTVRFDDDPPAAEGRRSVRGGGAGWYRFGPYGLKTDEVRMILTVTATRAQWLQDISEEDAWAEGVHGNGTTRYQGEGVALFRRLWRSINGKRAPWVSNPPVWAYTFEEA